MCRMRPLRPIRTLRSKPMQLGFVSAILPDLSLGDVLQFAAAEGL